MGGEGKRGIRRGGRGRESREEGEEGIGGEKAGGGGGGESGEGEGSEEKGNSYTCMYTCMKALLALSLHPGNKGWYSHRLPSLPCHQIVHRYCTSWYSTCMYIVQVLYMLTLAVYVDITNHMKVLGVHGQVMSCDHLGEDARG